jgi:hypothetical protein
VNKKRYLIILGVLVAALALSILFRTVLTNHQPVVTSLQAEPDRVLPLGSCQIVCNATDPDGDKLSYNWSVSGGAITGEGATVNWAAPDCEASHAFLVDVTVTDGRGGEATDYANILVITDRAPTIDSLVAGADWTAPSGSIQVTCNASDPFGNELSYQWTAAAGHISGAGAAISWIAPEKPGIYSVTVEVKNGGGYEDARSISLSVAAGTPPTVESLTVTAKEPKYLITTSYGYTVGRTKQYGIACNVSGPTSGVCYNWSCESGVIFGQGPVIIWTAPDQSLERTVVSVIVSDLDGNMVIKSVDFKVADCTQCTFG